MPKVARVGVDLVGGTGVITGPGAPTISVENAPLSLVGDSVSAHGESPHATPVIITGTSNIIAENKPLSINSISIATCGHSVTTGAPTVFAN